jgi:hypothetical protein
VPSRLIVLAGLFQQLACEDSGGILAGILAGILGGVLAGPGRANYIESYV